MPRRDALHNLTNDLAPEMESFFEASGARGELRVASAPGRLDLLGTLGAGTGSTVAQMALPARAAVGVKLSERAVLSIHSERIVPPIGRAEVEIPLAALGEELPAHGAWARPIVRLWRALGEAYPGGGRGGAAIFVNSVVPMSASQGSSTALLAAVATAVCSLWKVPADAMALARLIAGSRSWVGSDPGPLLDATTCLLADTSGGRQRIFRYSTQPFELVGQAPLPADLKVLAMDTGVPPLSQRTGGGGGGGPTTLDELRVAASMGAVIIDTIYRDLGRKHTPLHGYLANTSPLLYRQYFRALLPRRLRGSDFLRTYGALAESPSSPLPALDPAAMYPVRTAVDHFIAENEHAEQFLQAVEDLTDDAVMGKTDAEERQRTLLRAGRLLLASHHSYRLRLELSCREADWLVDRLMDAGPEKGIYGARITGVGGGGTVAALIAGDSREASDTILEVMRGYHQVTGLALTILEAGTGGSEGALMGVGA